MKDICYLDEVLSGILGDHTLWQGHGRPLSAVTVSVGLHLDHSFIYHKVPCHEFPNVFRTVNFPNAVLQPLSAIIKPVKSPTILLMSFKVE